MFPSMGKSTPLACLRKQENVLMNIDQLWLNLVGSLEIDINKKKNPKLQVHGRSRLALKIIVQSDVTHK